MQKIIIRQIITGVLLIIFSNTIQAQHLNNDSALSPEQQSIIAISALTAKGDLPALKTELNVGLDAGLTINQIKEAIVHTYAYCGFPRSIRGLQTFMEVLDERKAKGINDIVGVEASQITDDRDKFERGKEILGKLTGVPQDGLKAGYAEFAPIIEVFLKEHLFADIFERDVLSYAERELVTISVISAIGNAESMLRSHLKICLNVDLTPDQLHQFIGIIKKTIGEEEAKAAEQVLNDVLSA